MTSFRIENNVITRIWNGETLTIQAWGPNAVRVRATKLAEFPNHPDLSALVEQPEGAQPAAEMGEKDGSAFAVLTNGKIRAQLDDNGRLHFFNTQSGDVLLEEPTRIFWSYPARDFQTAEGGLYHLEALFNAQPGERIYGLGQHQHGLLNQKGCVIRLVQTNTEVAIPFALSSRGYGFLWNNPAVGRVEFAENLTRWVADGTRQLDYVIFVGDTPAEIIEAYVTATGRPPLLPD